MHGRSEQLVEVGAEKQLREIEMRRCVLLADAETKLRCVFLKGRKMNGFSNPITRSEF